MLCTICYDQINGISIMSPVCSCKAEYCADCYYKNPYYCPICRIKSYPVSTGNGRTIMSDFFKIIIDRAFEKLTTNSDKIIKRINNNYSAEFIAPIIFFVGVTCFSLFASVWLGLYFVFNNLMRIIENIQRVYYMRYVILNRIATLFDFYLVTQFYRLLNYNAFAKGFYCCMDD